MKSFFLRVTVIMLVIGALAGCTKDDLSAIDVKVDGSFESSYSVGKSSSGAYSRTRMGVGF